jgi:hypothetical protein
VSYHFTTLPHLKELSPPSKGTLLPTLKGDIVCELVSEAEFHCLIAIEHADRIAAISLAA